MSNKDKAKQIIDALPDYKIDRILLILQGIQIDDEIKDDLFCENLVERYMQYEDYETVPFEQAIKEAGLTIDEL